MKKIVFDIETRNTFQEAGSNDPVALEISVVCLYDYETDSYHSFVQEEFSKMWPFFEKADMLIGYNSDYFDIPLLNKYYAGDLTKIKSLDILKEIKNSAGRRMKLDQIAEGTLGVNKSGHGLEAVEWWKKGEIEKIKKYCLDDVKITKMVYDYALKNNKLIFKEGPKMNEVKLNTSKWEELQNKPSMTFSLPF
jgi:DEAD/DEAH box helicase domain-containing protein